MNKIPIILLTIIFMVSGCAGVGNHQLILSGDKDASLHVVINDDELKGYWPCRFKYESYCTEFVDKLSEALNHSYKKISKRSGYIIPKPGELLVIPQKLDLNISDVTGGRLFANATATIKVVTDVNNKSYNIDGASHHELSLATRIVLVPIMIVTGIVGTFVGDPAGGAMVPTKLWRGGVASSALESLAADFQNKIGQSAASRTPRANIQYYISEKILSAIRAHGGWKRVAIAEFKIQGMAPIDIEDYLAKQLDDEESGQKRGLTVVSKSFQDQALAKLDKDFSQLVMLGPGNRYFINHNDVIKFGNLTSADVILMGSLAEQSGKIYLKAQFIDTSNAVPTFIDDEAIISDEEN